MSLENGVNKESWASLFKKTGPLFTSNLSGLDQIAKFDGKDFQLWKYQVVLFLEMHGLMGIVDGTQKFPEGDDKTLQNNWNHKDIVARFCLSSMVEYSCLKSLLSCKSSAEMWTKLNAIYQPKDDESRFHLQSKFYLYKYVPGSSMIDHISTLEAMAEQLRDNGDAIPERKLVDRIVDSLPIRFRSFMTASLFWPESDKTMAILTERLLREEKRHVM